MNINYEQLGLIESYVLKLLLNSKISGIAIKCHVGIKGSVGDLGQGQILTEKECDKSVTQCKKEGADFGKVFSHFNIFSVIIKVGTKEPINIFFLFFSV